MWSFPLLLVLLAVWWVLLQQRVLPAKVMQYWFLLVNLLTIFPASGLTAISAPLRWIGVPQYYTQRLAIVPLACAFRVVWLLNPQVRMYIKFDASQEDGKPKSWYDLPKHGCAIVGNHTSFWDVYSFIIMYPLARIHDIRTLLKSSLLAVPLFGGAMVRVGNFPVYFTSDEDGNFQVDKERQAVVQKGVDRHILEGGNIAVYPEGALNKNPAVLQPFRYGTFQTIMDHKLTVYYYILVGNQQTWARTSMMGGRPADICARVGAFPIDFEKEDAKTVATRMQAHMQQVYDEAARDLENLKVGKHVAGYKRV